MSKLKEISTDLKQFEEILKIIPDERKTIAQKLITEICFMTKTLEDLRKTIRAGETNIYERKPCIKGIQYDNSAVQLAL